MSRFFLLFLLFYSTCLGGRIGIIGDLHWTDRADRSSRTPTSGSRFYSESDTDVTTFGTAMDAAQVDCVIEMGDIIDDSGNSDPQTDLNTIEDLYDNFSGPRYHVIGNWDHSDSGWADDDDFFDQIENGEAGDVSTIDDFPETDAKAYYAAGSESAENISRYYSFAFPDGSLGVVLDLTGVDDASGDYIFGTTSKQTIVPADQQTWLSTFLGNNTSVPIVVFTHLRIDNNANYADVKATLEGAGNVVAVISGDIHPGDGAYWKDGAVRSFYDQGLQPAPGESGALINGVRHYHCRAPVIGWGETDPSTANEVDPCDYDTWTEGTPANAYYIAHIGRNLGEDGKFWIHVHGYGTNPGGKSDSRHMLSRWLLNDATGQTTVESTNGNEDGTSVNNVNRGTGAPLNYDASMLFNGSSDAVRATSVILDGYPFTVSSWVKRTGSLASDKTIFATGKVGALNISYGLRFNNLGNAQLWARDAGASDELTSSATYEDDRWHNITGVWTSATSRELYVDGDSVGTDTSSTGWNATTDTWSIGRRVGTGAQTYWDGSIADVRVYDIALNSEQVEGLFEDGAIAPNRHRFAYGDHAQPRR